MWWIKTNTLFTTLPATFSLYMDLFKEKRYLRKRNGDIKIRMVVSVKGRNTVSRNLIGRKIVLIGYFIIYCNYLKILKREYNKDIVHWLHPMDINSHNWTTWKLSPPFSSSLSLSFIYSFVIEMKWRYGDFLYCEWDKISPNYKWDKTL